MSLPAPARRETFPRGSAATPCPVLSSRGACWPVTVPVGTSQMECSATRTELVRVLAMSQDLSEITRRFAEPETVIPARSQS